MRKVTNLHLVTGAVVCGLLIGVAILWNPFGSAAEQQKVALWTVGIGFLVAILAGVVERALRKGHSFWQKPVSTRLANILTNTVVCVWLAVVALIVFLLVRENPSPKAAAVAAFLVLTGWGLGRYFQTRSGSSSLLPYGVSFFLALGFAFLILALIGT